MPFESSAAALIVAHNAARYVASTVRAALAIPGIDLVLVVDDGSLDATQDAARHAGAVVVRHSHERGRSSGIETGSSVIAMRDEAESPRAVLLLDPATGAAASGAAPLVQAVLERVTDLAIARNTNVSVSGGAPSAVARNAVERISGWAPDQPLNPTRCLTRETLEVCLPLSRGAGCDVGMTLDALVNGLSVTEVDCDIPVRSQSLGRRDRLAQYRDVMMAVASRRVRGVLSTSSKDQ